MLFTLLVVGLMALLLAATIVIDERHKALDTQRRLERELRWHTIRIEELKRERDDLRRMLN